MNIAASEEIDAHRKPYYIEHERKSSFFDRTTFHRISMIQLEIEAVML